MNITSPAHLPGPGPMVTISGLANFGGSNAVGDKYQEKIPSFNDNFTWIRGAHTIKFGVGFQQNLDTQLAGRLHPVHLRVHRTIYSREERHQSTGIFQPQRQHRPAGRGLPLYLLQLSSPRIRGSSERICCSPTVRATINTVLPTPPAGEPFVYTQSFHTPLGNISPRVWDCLFAEFDVR